MGSEGGDCIEKVNQSAKNQACQTEQFVNHIANNIYVTALYLSLMHSNSADFFTLKFYSIKN